MCVLYIRGSLNIFKMLVDWWVGFVWFYLPLLYVRTMEVKIYKYCTTECSTEFFFRNECLIVKRHLCVAGTEATDGTMLKTNGKNYFLRHFPSL